MSRLAVLYEKQGRYDEARPLVIGFMAWQKRQAERSANAETSNDFAWTGGGGGNGPGPGGQSGSRNRINDQHGAQGSVPLQRI